MNIASMITTIQATKIYSDLLELVELSLIFFLVVFLHELGHFIGARRSRLRLEHVYTGPFKFTFDNGFKVKVNRNFMFAFGICTNLAVIGDYNNINKRFFRTLIGGPIASLITGILGLVLYGITTVEQILVLSIMSLAIAFATCFSDVKTGLMVNSETSLGNASLLYQVLHGDALDEKMKDYVRDYFSRPDDNAADRSALMNEAMKYQLVSLGLFDLEIKDIMKQLEVKMPAYLTLKNNNDRMMLFSMLTAAALLCHVKKDMSAAAICYEYLKQVHVKKDKMMLMELQFIASLLESKDKNIYLKAYEQYFKKYDFKGYTHLNREILKAI